MSILIRGMEMPTSCDDCKLRMAVGCCGNLPHNTRMPNCPVGPVPPHGRLIDADALTDCLATLLQFPSNLVNGQWIVNTLREQPTIIPADKDGAE